jgi:hypothetical protein
MGAYRVRIHLAKEKGAHVGGFHLAEARFSLSRFNASTHLPLSLRYSFLSVRRS